MSETAAGRRGWFRGIPSTRFLTRWALDRFLAQTIFRLRWATIAALLLISIAQPSAGRSRFADWMLILVFAGYNLLVQLARWRFGRPALAGIAVLDLPVIGLIYANCNQPGGPLFALLVLAAVQTAAFMTLVGSLLYTAALGLILIMVEPTFPSWSSSLADVRSLGARLVVLGVVGIGVGTLTRRLESERSAAQTVFGEAERLEELDRLRADFVSTVSHELRTPLTAARAGLGMLEGSTADRLRADEGELLANARRNIERLNLLIDDLLAYNQLAAGTLHLDEDAIDLRMVVTDVVAAMHSLLETKAQTLELDLAEPLPLRGDAGRLERVLLNVVANAHRYTPTGTRIVIAGRVAGEEVLVSVSDTGPGIPVSELEAIFGRFHRLSTDGGGSGLGLAVARGIVELHGGRMWAESPAGGGASFHLAFRHAEAEGERRR